MSAQAPNVSTAPSDKDTPNQDRDLFHHEARKHESHHYVRMYGGRVLQAAAWGFGATLGADAANAAVGDVKVGSSLWTTIEPRAEDITGMVAPLKSTRLDYFNGKTSPVKQRRFTNYEI